MPRDRKSKGTWFHRFAIQFFTVVLALLVYWFLGFLVEDIRSLPGPDYEAIERQYVSPELVAKHTSLESQTADLKRQIDNQTEKQRIIGDTSRNLQQTITQLVELQKLGLQKSVPLSETEQANFTNSLHLFLENQRKYQELSQTAADILDQYHALVREKEQTEKEIERQREPARDEYKRANTQHRLRLAVYQLLVLLPVLVIAGVVIVRKRSSIYFPLFLAFGAATLIKVTLVAHEYFPTRYFKYVLIVSLLLVVARLLVYFIRAIAFPKVQWLVRQYRESYERFLCPICEYPIRVGPRRYLFWTRRTAGTLNMPAEREDSEERYTCPACGSSLFEECTACGKVRHTLLPHCVHCGAEKAIA